MLGGGGGNLKIDKHPVQRGEVIVTYFWSLHAKEIGMNSGFLSHLGLSTDFFFN